MSTPQAIRLEPLVVEDFPWLLPMERELHAHPWTEGNFRDALDSGYDALAVRRGEARLGYLVLMHILDETHLLTIGIDRALQGQGLGAQTLEQACRRSRERGSTCMFLEVRPSNGAAIALYRKLGFAEIGRRRGYYPSAQGREDALVMRCAL